MLGSHGSLRWILLFLVAFVSYTLEQSTPIILHCGADSRVEIEETVIDSPVIDVEWLSGDIESKKYIFVRSKNRLLYRSEDEGRSWSDETDKLRTAKGSKGNPITLIGINEIIRTSNNDMIWFIGNGNDTWVTINKGKDYLYRDTGLTFLSIKANPEKPQFALGVTTTRKCSNRNDPGNCYQILHLTQNFGATWTPIETYVGQYYWGVSDNIWVEGWPKQGDQPFYNRLNTTLYKSDNLGLNWNYVISNVAGYIMKFDTLFIAQYVNEEGHLRLYSGRNYGEKPFRVARLSIQLDETRYSILDTTDDFVFLSVQHEDPTWGNIYVSDNEENNFVLSLPMSTRDVYGHTDFTKVQTLNGIYIANMFKDTFAVQNKEIRSMVTFNNGGEWTPLQPPTVDSLGNPISCRNCILNLYGDHKQGTDSGDFGPLHSKANAVGLLMGTGNVGKFLDDEVVNTYFSHDAGQSWQEVRKGSHIYEFGNHGGIIAMAKNREDTDRLLYSFNMGISWTECIFTDGTTLNVLDIVSEPNNTAQSFVLHGTRQQNGREVGVLVHLDFNNLHNRPCNDSDYEYWSPSDVEGRNCFLGEKITYTRRKRDSECYNPIEYEPKQSLGSCKCAQADYECDFCFEPYKGDGYTCVFACEDRNSIAKPPADCQDYYYVTKGYRKVDGTKCQGGLDLSPDKIPCPKPQSPSPSNNQLSSKEVVLIVLLIAGLMLVTVSGCLVLSIKSERFRRIIHRGYGRLPPSIRDPFKGTSFIRLDNVDEDEVGLLSGEDDSGSLKELDEEHLTNTFKTFKLN